MEKTQSGRFGALTAFFSPSGRVRLGRSERADHFVQAVPGYDLVRLQIVHEGNGLDKLLDPETEFAQHSPVIILVEQEAVDVPDDVQKGI